MNTLRQAWPDTRTIEGRALWELQLLHSLYRDSVYVDDRQRCEWRRQAQTLAEIISGRRYPWPLL